MAGVKITETVLRDANQSLIATKMTTEDMLPILKKMDEVGYHSLEVWGGATFDASIRFLNEDPWIRLRKIKDVVKKTKLQMLLRGQSLLGYKHYADDVVEYFIQKSVENGIDIIRVFDALNDLRNLETSIMTCKKEGVHVQGCICYTLSPVHSLELFVKDAKQIEEMGADSICIKDMAGLLVPFKAYELVKALKENVKIPVQVHTHYTSGVASMTYLKAIEAGADAVDCAISTMSMGRAHPPTESLVASLKDTSFDTGLELDKLSEIADYFKPLKEKYIDSNLLDLSVMGVDVNTLRYQVPGGMLANIISQLKNSNAFDRFEEALREVQGVREDLGFPPLVTPTSLIVGTQAVLNIITGERYKLVPNELKSIVKGEYGKTPAPISEEIISKIIGDEKPITCRPADLLEPELEKTRDKIKEFIEQDEDVLSYAMLPQVAVKFFKQRIDAKKKPSSRKKAGTSEKISPEIVAAITAAVHEMGIQNGKQYSIRNISQVGARQNQNRWSLYGMLDRFRTKI